MSAEKIRYEARGGIGWITLCDPPANTYSYAMMRELDAAVLEARMDGAVHAIVLRGEGADAEFGLFAADRKLASASDVRGELADPLKDAAPERHVRADQVAYLVDLGRHPDIRATDDPVELVGKPRGPCGLPVCVDAPPCADHVVRLVVAHQELCPVARRARVIVEEGDHVGA